MTEIQIVIPMAGLGTRFINAGYKTPKPFIEVLGEPMINMIIKNFKSYNHKIKFFLIALKEHSSKIDNTNNLYTIIEVDNITEGQACSVLLARNYLNLDNPILIANCDQYLEWNFDDFIKFANENDIDGLISTFKNNDFSTPKWSYVSLNADKYIQTVAEKEAISNYA